MRIFINLPDINASALLATAVIRNRRVIALVVAKRSRIPKLLASDLALVLRQLQQSVSTLLAVVAVRTVLVRPWHDARLPFVLRYLEAGHWLRNAREGLIRIHLSLAICQRHIEALRILHLQDIAQGLVAVHKVLALLMLRVGPHHLGSTSTIYLIIHCQTHGERVACRAPATQPFSSPGIESVIL